MTQHVCDPGDIPQDPALDAVDGTQDADAPQGGEPR